MFFFAKYRKNMKSWLIPTSPSARFIGCFLNNVTPTILLPPNYIESFLLADSQLTYTNRINENEPFTVNKSFSSSINSPFDQSRSIYYKPSGSNSLLIPSESLMKSRSTSILPKDKIPIISPPGGSDVIVLDPMFMQIEHMFERGTKGFKVWSLSSTHLLKFGYSNGFSVDHLKMGEMKLSLYNGEVEQSDLRGIIGALINTPELNVQFESYLDSYVNRIDNLVTKLGLIPYELNNEQTEALKEALQVSSLEEISTGLLVDLVTVINQISVTKTLRTSSPLINSCLNVGRFQRLIKIELLLKQKWTKSIPSWVFLQRSYQAQGFNNGQLTFLKSLSVNSFETKFIDELLRLL